MKNAQDIQTAGGVQDKFKSGLLMKFVKGKIEWFLKEKVWKNAFDSRQEEVETFEPISSKEAETSINGYKEYK